LQIRKVVFNNGDLGARPPPSFWNLHVEHRP
jgi:hypothetical protein